MKSPHIYNNINKSNPLLNNSIKNLELDILDINK
jgi:hypothetical protein